VEKRGGEESRRAGREESKWLLACKKVAWNDAGLKGRGEAREPCRTRKNIKCANAFVVNKGEGKHRNTEKTSVSQIRRARVVRGDVPTMGSPSKIMT